MTNRNAAEMNAYIRDFPEDKVKDACDKVADKQGMSPEKKATLWGMLVNAIGAPLVAPTGKLGAYSQTIDFIEENDRFFQELGEELRQKQEAEERECERQRAIERQRERAERFRETHMRLD